MSRLMKATERALAFLAATQEKYQYELNRDREGETLASKIIGLGIALFVTAFLFPLGLNQLANATMPNVNSSVRMLLTILVGAVASLAVVIMFVKYAED